MTKPNQRSNEQTDEAWTVESYPTLARVVPPESPRYEQEVADA